MLSAFEMSLLFFYLFSAVLDGVDLNIEAGRHDFYTDFVKEIRRLMDSNTGRQYIIGASPQCPFPDHFLGPKPGYALGDVCNLFDEVHVQFYNNFCTTSDSRKFLETFNKWLAFSDNCTPKKGPKIFVGLPAHARATASSSDFRPLNELKTIYQVFFLHLIVSVMF